MEGRHVPDTGLFGFDSRFGGVARSSSRSVITDTFADATELLEEYPPEMVGELEGKDWKLFADPAGELAAYDEGPIGPGHYGEDGNSAATRTTGRVGRPPGGSTRSVPIENRRQFG
jgi:hypothetical protein